MNSGQFFGLFGTNFSALITSLFLLSIFFYFTVKNKLYFSGWFVIVGAGSNIFSRIIYGGVWDYFHLYFIPAFNVADVFIVLGLISSLIFYIKKDLRVT